MTPDLEKAAATVATKTTQEVENCVWGTADFTVVYSYPNSSEVCVDYVTVPAHPLKGVAVANAVKKFCETHNDDCALVSVFPGTHEDVLCSLRGFVGDAELSTYDAQRLAQQTLSPRLECSAKCPVCSWDLQNYEELPDAPGAAPIICGFCEAALVVECAQEDGQLGYRAFVVERVGSKKKVPT
jgi:hypothetical protein